MCAYIPQYDTSYPFKIRAQGFAESYGSSNGSGIRRQFDYLPIYRGRGRATWRSYEKMEVVKHTPA